MTPSTSEHRTSPLFTGDRYQRLLHGVDVLSADPAISDASQPFNGDGIRALAAAITARGLLDHLDDTSANAVSAMLLVDFYDGAPRLAARITQLIDDAAVGGERPTYEALAIISGLAGVLALVIDTEAWLSEPAEERGAI